MKHLKRHSLALALAVGISESYAASVAIDWVTVGDPGNPAQSATNRAHGFSGGDTRGAVDYTFGIGKYAVTNNQYASFLNSIAQSDPRGLYSADMSGVYGGIQRSGTSGSYVYQIKAGMANKPVNYVSWYSAARFANWLHNGQGAGSTETGAYTMDGSAGYINDEHGASSYIPRNPGATVWMPSLDEWFKAAYYNGATGMYSAYAIGADTISTSQANYGASVGLLETGELTDVGAYPFPSYYGTYDQTGNTREWPGLRGGSYYESATNSSQFSSISPAYKQSFVGFRVATSAIPEPGSAMGLMLVLSGAVFIRRKG